MADTAIQRLDDAEKRLALDAFEAAENDKVNQLEAAEREAASEKELARLKLDGGDRSKAFKKTRDAQETVTVKLAAEASATTALARATFDREQAETVVTELKAALAAYDAAERTHRIAELDLDKGKAERDMAVDDYKKKNDVSETPEAEPA